MGEKRKLTPEQIAQQLRGATRLGHGAWIDREGGLHFSVPELLALFGEADTPENRRMIEDLIKEVVRREAPDAEVIEQE